MKKISYIVCLFLITVSAVAQSSQSLSLKQAINYAIKNNYDNKIAIKNIDAAKKRKWETTTMGLPQINAKVEYQNWLKQQVSLLPAAAFDNTKSTIAIVENYFDGVTRRNIPIKSPEGFIPIRFGTKQTMNAAATLTQLIFDGSYLVGLQSAKTYLKISEQAKIKTELATKEAVINAYGNVLIVQKSIEILQGNKAVLRKTLSETQKIYDNGLAELESVEQLQITLGTLENNLKNAKRMKEIAYKMLNIALGNKINKKLKLTDTLEKLSEKNDGLNLLAKTFNINNHIDYKIAQNNRESKRLLVKFEQSKGLPSLVAFVNYGTNANSDNFSFLNKDQKWFEYSLFGVNLNIPIFSSLERSSKVARAKIELENADIKLEEIKQKLNLQAQAAKSEYQLSIESLSVAKKNLELAKRIEKKHQIKFFEGISSSFDLLQAQNQLYTQQNNYVQAMLNLIAKKATLETALNVPIKNN